MATGGALIRRSSTTAAIPLRQRGAVASCRRARAVAYHGKQLPPMQWQGPRNVVRALRRPTIQ
eukprot:15478187-Alexandrium_andersonii.AAC.1